MLKIAEIEDRLTSNYVSQAKNYKTDVQYLLNVILNLENQLTEYESTKDELDRLRRMEQRIIKILSKLEIYFGPTA